MATIPLRLPIKKNEESPQEAYHQQDTIPEKVTLPMTDYIELGVKDIMERYPEVGVVLRDFGIGCVDCSARSCTLRDVVTLHSLPPDKLSDMAERLASALDDDERVSAEDLKQRLARAPQAGASGSESESPVITRLKQEHRVISRWTEQIPAVIQMCAAGKEGLNDLLLRAADFMSNYADRYHHAKEEDLLFESIEQEFDAFDVMRDEHRRARALTASVREAAEEGNPRMAEEPLRAYRELLREHIWKENEVFYPWMDRELSDRQVGKLFSAFRDVDQDFGDAPTEDEGGGESTDRTLNARQSKQVSHRAVPDRGECI